MKYQRLRGLLVNIKNAILLILGAYFMLGDLIIIETDIRATLFFGTIGMICIFFGKELIYKYTTEKENKEQERKEELQQIYLENKIRKKEMELQSELKLKQIELENKRTVNKIEKEIKKYSIVDPSDLQIKVTIEKIQELYKEQGFNVKVIDIIKNKYNLEYEVIFSQETTQYEILSISGKIKDEFKIDGVNIKGKKNKYNRIIISIPLEYKEVTKTLT